MLCLNMGTGTLDEALAWTWNNFLWPFLAATSPTMMTIPAGLGTVVTGVGIVNALQMASREWRAPALSSRAQASPGLADEDQRHFLQDVPRGVIGDHDRVEGIRTPADRSYRSPEADAASGPARPVASGRRSRAPAEWNAGPGRRGRRPPRRLSRWRPPRWPRLPPLRPLGPRIHLQVPCAEQTAHLYRPCFRRNGPRPLNARHANKTRQQLKS